jgi:predicted transcriptional regulator
LSESRKLILTTVLKKQNNLFNQTEIVQETELPQSVVSYHLSTLRDKGYLNKGNGKRGHYRITDLSEFLALCLEEKTTKTKKPSTDDISEHVFDVVEKAAAIKALRVKCIDVVDDKILESLDALIEDAKQLKRWYRELSPTREEAIKVLSGKKQPTEALSELWETSGIIRASYGQKEWNDFIDAVLAATKEDAI